jgi:putative Ca2+/H+ antiporter (TMEM165/GDT1 family)
MILLEYRTGRQSVNGFCTGASPNPLWLFFKILTLYSHSIRRPVVSAPTVWHSTTTKRASATMPSFAMRTSSLQATKHSNNTNNNNPLAARTTTVQTTTLRQKVVKLATTVLVSTTAMAAILFVANPAHAALLPSVPTAPPAAAWSLAETGFYQAFSLVFLSEIGDKTFFIAGLLSAKTGKVISFVGSIAALSVMTVLSVVLGQVFHSVPSGIADLPLDDIAACGAFLFFCIKTIKEALELKEGESIMDEELEDAKEAVDGSKTVTETTPWGQIVSIFALVFAAEFGDRSFISTIALSAAQNPVSVAAGAIAAHAVATGIAVLGGSVVARNISERWIGIIGGSLFIVFAFTTALGIF